MFIIFLNYKKAVCKECGKVFEMEEPSVYAYQYKGRRFCSYRCYNKFLARREERFAKKHGCEFLGK